MSAWYTPNTTLREAVTSIRWSYALAFFVLPCTAVGFQEGIPVLGFSVGAGFVAYMVFLQWWLGVV